MSLKRLMMFLLGMTAAFSGASPALRGRREEYNDLVYQDPAKAYLMNRIESANALNSLPFSHEEYQRMDAMYEEVSSKAIRTNREKEHLKAYLPNTLKVFEIMDARIPAGMLPSEKLIREIYQEHRDLHTPEVLFQLGFHGLAVENSYLQGMQYMQLFNAVVENKSLNELRLRTIQDLENHSIPSFGAVYAYLLDNGKKIEFSDAHIFAMTSRIVIPLYQYLAENGPVMKIEDLEDLLSQTRIHPGVEGRGLKREPNPSVTLYKVMSNIALHQIQENLMQFVSKGDKIHEYEPIARKIQQISRVSLDHFLNAVGDVSPSQKNALALVMGMMKNVIASIYIDANLIFMEAGFRKNQQAQNEGEGISGEVSNFSMPMSLGIALFGIAVNRFFFLPWMRRQVAELRSLDSVIETIKFKKQKEMELNAKKKKPERVDPEILKQEEASRLQKLQEYEEQQAIARNEKEALEKQQAEIRSKIKEAQAKRDKVLGEVFNRVYKTLSTLKSDKGSVEKLFKGSGLRQTTLTKILESGIDYFIEGSHEINQKLLAKDILNKLDVTGHFHSDLVKQFDEIYEKGEDAVRARKALELAKAAELARKEAARLAEEARIQAEEAEGAEKQRMTLNKALYKIEKEKAKVKAPVVSSSSSSSSSSSIPVIGFSSKAEADQVKALLLEWMALVKLYQSPETISNDLFELKHDLIKLAAIAEQINLKGARALVNSLFHYPTLKVIRNGALHLLEISEDEAVQVEFYQGVLLQLGTIASLDINEEALAKGLNHLMKHTIREWPGVDFSAQTEHSMFKSFEADAVTWKDDHEKKMRSDVIEAIEARQQWLDETPSTRQKRRTMIQAEIAELYHQLKNTGAKIPNFAHGMIAAKNAFAHEGHPINHSSVLRMSGEVS